MVLLTILSLFFAYSCVALSILILKNYLKPCVVEKHLVLPSDFFYIPWTFFHLISKGILCSFLQKRTALTIFK